VGEQGRRLFERRRDLFLDVLGPTGAVAARPGGAFYGLVHIGDEAESALAFAKRLLVESGIAVVPGETFGATTARMVRLAFTIDDADLHTGLERLRAFLRRYPWPYQPFSSSLRRRLGVYSFRADRRSAFGQTGQHLLVLSFTGFDPNPQ